MKNRLQVSRFLLVVPVTAALTSACSGDAPTGPSSETSITSLHVEPDAGLAPGDPDGIVSIEVLPAADGGRLTIQVCVDEQGGPVLAEGGLDCQGLGGTWTPATDATGQTWDARPWGERQTIRLTRHEGQAAMLFSASYRAGVDRDQDVEQCPWVLAEGRDVGVICTSDGRERVLPRMMPAYPTSYAR